MGITFNDQFFSQYTDFKITTFSYFNQNNTEVSTSVYCFYFLNKYSNSSTFLYFPGIDYYEQNNLLCE